MRPFVFYNHPVSSVAIFTKTIMHLVYPLKFCITFVFDFSWATDCNNRKKLETLIMTNLGGGGGEEVHYETFLRG